uniref:Innexin n=2 Tax=Caenorhabditis japonica TaxID=281687 RepID=A0A8R1IEB1_CAEJA
MQCWTPNQFTGVWEAFAEQYCFIENTYFVPWQDSNLPDVETREDREMIYYQWVPFLLIIQALFFCIPRAYWIIYPSYSGLTIADMITAARKTGKKLESADQALEQVALTNWQAHRGSSRIFNCYLVMKLLILINVILQFFLLNSFLNTAYTFWGWGVFWDMVNGRHWQESGHFPRVSFCDINVRELGNVHHWSLQCVLMVNMFNEKIFIFLWFWFAFLLVATTFDFVVWVWRRFDGQSRIGFIMDLLVS